MFIEERHEKIVDIINERKRILVPEIEKRFGISAASARRDLRILEEKGKLKRTHGGAISINYSHDLFVSQKEESPRQMETVFENYECIAEEACKLIEEGECVFITSGTVGVLMAKKMPMDKNFTVLTNSVIVADELCKYSNITVVMCGGQLNQKGSSHDFFAVDMIKRFHIDKAFLTSAAISKESGAMLPGTVGVAIMNEAIKKSKKAVGLFPCEKIGKESAVTVCELCEFDLLLTDKSTPDEFIKDCELLGVEVIVV